MTRLRGFIPPGAVLGVMGGGQLARMFVHAAQQMGYATAVLDADPLSPAGLVSHLHVQTAYLDARGLSTLAESCAAITTEFENVPADALARLASRRPVSPSAASVAICQDRAAEKAHFARGGVACAPHALIRSAVDFEAVESTLLPGILKTARLGYDGKGQMRVETLAQLREAWSGSLRGVPCVLEKLLPLAREISVIVARGADGGMVHLPPQQNIHRHGILVATHVPVRDVAPALSEKAIADAKRIAVELDYVGVLCIEFFVLTDCSLVANEMAPRPHNSGHYSIDACDVSQFDLQVRTLVAAPLTMPRLHSPCVMLNLMGELWPDGDVTHGPDWVPVLAIPGAHLHLYGKSEARSGRKMGHLTITAASAEEADRRALEAAALLGIAPW